MTVHTKINHVAMSVPANQLDQATRDDIMAFYSEVFGWSENTSKEPGTRSSSGLASRPSSCTCNRRPGTACEHPAWTTTGWR